MTQDQDQNNARVQEQARQAAAKLKAIYDETKAKLDELQKKQEAIIEDFLKRSEQAQLEKARQNISDSNN